MTRRDANGTIAVLQPYSGTTLFRRSALAAAVTMAFAPLPVQAEDWSRNIEVFGMPTTKGRNLWGIQWLEPIWQDNVSLFYADVRGVLDLHETDEVNIGLGYRRMFADRRWILGGYTAFDTRNTTTNNRFNQITVGLEALSREWDLRTNFYIPITKEKTVGPGTAGGLFTGTRLFADGVVEEALEGADFEIGRLLDFIPFGETRLFVGGYHFRGEVAPSTRFGKKARMEFRPRKDIALELGVTDDRTFGTEGFLKIRYSFGMPGETGVRTIDERMVQFVERDIDIKTTDVLPENIRESSKARHRALVSSNVVHIDNTNTQEDRDGSFENPYNSVGECNTARCVNNQGALIYVHASEGGATDPYNGSFALENNQRLFGQGFSLYGIGGDYFPTLQPGGDFGVYMNRTRNNEVAGLHFDGFGGGSKYGGITADNARNFNIHHNIFTDNSIGILAINSEGVNSGRIENNYFYGNNLGIGAFNANKYADNSSQILQISGNTMYGNMFGGKYVNAAAGGGGTATQTINSNNNISVYNDIIGSKYMNAGIAGGTATQTINSSNNITGFSEIGSKYLNTGKYGTATQTINSSNNISTYNDVGSKYANTGKYGGTATQTVNAVNRTITGNYLGAVIENDAGNYGGTANQTINLTGANLSGNYYGAVIENYAGEYGTANQTVNLSGANLSNNYYIGARIQNEYEIGILYNGTANQNVDLNGANVGGTYQPVYANGTPTQIITLPNGSTNVNSPLP